jgi:hypothetical protein
MNSHPTNPEWRQVVQRLLKAEMSKRGVKYQDLSAMEANLALKS